MFLVNDRVVAHRRDTTITVRGWVGMALTLFEEGDTTSISVDNFIVYTQE